MPNPTISPAVSLYLDGDLPGGRDAALDGTTGNPPALALALCQADIVSLRVYFRRKGTVGASSTALELAAGYGLVVAGKLASDLDAADPLFLVNSWTLTGTGTDGAYYAGSLNLNTVPIQAAFDAADAGDTLTLAVDVQVTIGGQIMTYRVAATLYRQGYADSGTAALVTPSVSLTSPAGYVWQLTIDDNGTLSATRIQ
jgi:hypothetical protein